MQFPDAQPSAQRRIPTWRLVLNNLLAVRYNPLGLEDQIRFGMQRRLYKNFDEMLRDNFVFLGIYPKINPAFAKVGPSIEIQPLSIFNLRVQLEYVQFFSTFGFLQSFAAPTAAYGDTALAMNKDARKNYATNGIHVLIEPALTLKFGPILIRDKVSIEYWRMNLHDGERVWYDATLDTLVPGNGWVIANDLDAGYIKRFRSTAQLVVGARYSMVTPIYARSDFGDADPTEAERMTASANTHHRLGPLVAFTFFDKGFVGFNKPTLLFISGWYLSHRWRQGQDPASPTALPYLLLGFSFQSDFLKGT